MTEQIAEKIQTEQVTPAPATPEAVNTAPVTDTEATPVTNQTATDKKIADAFIKARQEKRELKQQLAEAQAKLASPPVVAPVVADPAVPVIPKEIPQAPAPVSQAANEIEAEGKKAIQALAEDKDVASVPGAIIDILDTLDNDSRLSRLYQIDPTIAIREAKALWASKAGIAQAPTIPLSNTSSGGMGGSKKDLESLFAEIDKTRPGSKEYTTLVKKINAEMAKHPSELAT